MYVCICHGINEKKIEKVLEQGCSNVHEVHEKLGIALKCRKCEPTFCQMLKKLQTESGAQKAS